MTECGCGCGRPANHPNTAGRYVGGCRCRGCRNAAQAASWARRTEKDPEKHDAVIDVLLEVLDGP